MVNNPNVSLLTLLDVDFDYKSLYPSVMVMLNSSRDTFKSALFLIEGHEKTKVIEFSSHSILKRENAVMLCNEFLNLPDYREMHDLVGKELNKRGTSCN